MPLSFNLTLLSLRGNLYQKHMKLVWVTFKDTIQMYSIDYKTGGCQLLFLSRAIPKLFRWCWKLLFWREKVGLKVQCVGLGGNYWQKWNTIFLYLFIFIFLFFIVYHNPKVRMWIVCMWPLNESFICTEGKGPFTESATFLRRYDTVIISIMMSYNDPEWNKESEGFWVEQTLETGCKLDIHFFLVICTW